MIFLTLIPIAIIYSLYASITYLPWLKVSVWYYPLGILLPVLGNTLWLWVTRHQTDQSKLFLLSMSWDACVSLSFVLVPFLFFGLKLSPLGYLGIALLLIGLVLLKL